MASLGLHWSCWAFINLVGPSLALLGLDCPCWALIVLVGPVIAPTPVNRVSVKSRIVTHSSISASLIAAVADSVGED